MGFVIVKVNAAVVANEQFTVARVVTGGETTKIRITGVATFWNWHRKKAVLVGCAGGDLR